MQASKCVRECVNVFFKKVLNTHIISEDDFDFLDPSVDAGHLDAPVPVVSRDSEAGTRVGRAATQPAVVLHQRVLAPTLRVKPGLVEAQAVRVPKASALADS